jgi:predicted nucleic-acid-binding protein
MLALDTNVLCRLLLKDDQKQYTKVLALFKRNVGCTAPVSVFLELVWVLESLDRSPDEISESLLKLMSLPNFKPEQEQALTKSLALYAQGFDFGDALHWCLSEGASGLITFDQTFARRAGKVKAVHAIPVIGLAEYLKSADSDV